MVLQRGRAVGFWWEDLGLLCENLTNFVGVGVVTCGDVLFYYKCDLASYTGCPRRNVKYFGRVFLMLNYTDIT